MTEPYDSSHPDFWEQRYQSLQTPWDLRGPTPVFQKLIADGMLPVGKLLVPGAGRGYDAIAFARAGFDVTAIDLAPSACEELRLAGAAAGVQLDVRQADFFELEEAGCYDMILEYTFYCAIPVSYRPRYRDQMHLLLKPGGILCGLFFPLEPSDPDGPPFGVDRDVIAASFSEVFAPLHESFPVESIKPRAGREVLMLWHKP